MTDFNTQPQPRTFAPSKEDVLQNLQYFFGAPVSPEKLKDYSEHHAVTHHFPGLNSNHSQSNHSHVHLFFAMALIAPLLCARRRVHWPEHQCAQLLNSLFLQARIAHCALLITLCSTVAEIRDTLNNLILNSPQTWQTSVRVNHISIHGYLYPEPRIDFTIFLFYIPGRPALLSDPGHCRRVGRVSRAPSTPPPTLLTTNLAHHLHSRVCTGSASMCA